MSKPKMAGLGRRIASFIIDVVPGFVLFWSLVDALGDKAGEKSGTHITMLFEIVNGRTQAELFGTVYYLDGGTTAAVSIVGFAYWIGVLVVWQGLTGRTIGKTVVGIRTVDANGQPCGIGKAVKRWLLLVVDFLPGILPMLVGFVTALTWPGRQRIGDRVAKTWVVPKGAVGQPIEPAENTDASA